MTDAPFDIPDPEGHEIVQRLLAAEVALRVHFETSAAALGLSVTQAQTLLSLEQPRRMGEVADDLRCEPSHVTGIADTLAAEGYLRRETDPADRRAKRLVLTAGGRRLRDSLMHRLVDDAPIISVLAPDQRRELLSLLRIAQNPA
ncbi:MarR family winged helix-turn-helix transcriptional regulator [Nocardia asteroides]|uniref:MarR family winged helix-turn-helix transcriptional regulator n=1 Tax=Nocardia asteroides TaxID=1824 RepID=UPI001E5C9129|nr:MarR family winged helix-turn-helix transcriptional regulator [Nocardia asteroides]UGT57097.1 MarR family winged helix-turn-helix transcriptional regulator [Nocardia asteroides]